MNEYVHPEFEYTTHNKDVFQSAWKYLGGSGAGAIPLSYTYWTFRSFQENKAKEVGIDAKTAAYTSAAKGFLEAILHVAGANAAAELTDGGAFSIGWMAWGVRGLIDHSLRTILTYKTDRPTPGMGYLAADLLNDKFHYVDKIKKHTEKRLVPGLRSIGTFETGNIYK